MLSGINKLGKHVKDSIKDKCTKNTTHAIMSDGLTEADKKGNKYKSIKERAKDGDKGSDSSDKDKSKKEKDKKEKSKDSGSKDSDKDKNKDVELVQEEEFRRVLVA